MKWLFKKKDIDSAVKFHNKYGFVAFESVFSNKKFNKLLSAIDLAVKNRKIKKPNNTLISNNDVIFTHTEISKLSKDSFIVSFIERCLNRKIELQHSKLNSKPIKAGKAGVVEFHQDYPYYPHTNYDLITCIIHLDNSTKENGALEFIPSSNKLGPLSHIDSKGNFAYKCTDLKKIKNKKPVLLETRKGMISFHHCLTLHKSEPPKVDGLRRILAFQYRAIDSIQIGGIIRKSNGVSVYKKKLNTPKLARFVDNTVVEIRGNDGQLVDLFGKYRP